MGMIPQYFHTIPTSCVTLPTMYATYITSSKFIQGWFEGVRLLVSLYLLSFCLLTEIYLILWIRKSWYICVYRIWTIRNKDVIHLRFLCADIHLPSVYLIFCMHVSMYSLSHACSFKRSSLGRLICYCVVCLAVATIPHAPSTHYQL